MSGLKLRLAAESKRRLHFLCATHKLSEAECVEQMIDGVYESYIHAAAIEIQQKAQDATPET